MEAAALRQRRPPCPLSDACANAAERLPKDVQAFPVNYWDAFTESDIAEFSGLKNGLHANLICLVTRTDRKKEKMRRDMWSKVEIG